MTDLADFLLARIAEDEATARYAHDRFEVGDRPWRLRALDAGGVAAYTARVLAECEAKRRIVDAWRAGFPDEDRYAMGWHDFHVRALCLLALPYADHPDYREEWRP